MTWEDLKDEPTEDLIEYMKCKEDVGYLELAEAAYVAFNYRFRIDIEQKARTVGKYWGFDNETCDQEVEKAFKRFYQYPFKFAKSKCTTPCINDCVKFYFYSIVQNRFKDHYNELFNTNPSPYDGTEEVVVEFPKLESMELEPEVQEDLKTMQKKIEAVLNCLTHSHKIIYLTYKAYEKEGFKLPRKLLKELRQITGLSQNSIRVYKKQVFEEVNNILRNNAE